MQYLTKRISVFILFFTLFPYSLAQAKTPAQSDALLKGYDLITAETLVQDALIKQITITNIIKKNAPYKVSVGAGRAGSSNAVNVHALEKSFAPRGDALLAASAPRRAFVARGASSTNVREKGVDEADLVKTDGRYLFSLSSFGKNNGLRIYDTLYQGKGHQGKKLHQVAAVGFEKGLHIKGLYLLASQQKLVVVTETFQNKVRRRNWGGDTRLIFIDIRNKSQPRVFRRVNLEGRARSTKRIGNQLYVVLNSYSFKLPPTNKTIESSQPITQQQFDNEKKRLVNIIKAWRIDKQLPHYSEIGKAGTHSLINAGKFYLNMDDIKSYSLTSIVAIDLNAPRFSFNGIGYFGSPETVYVSPKSMYLSSSFHDNMSNSSNKNNKNFLDRNSFPLRSAKTLIHKFSIKGKHFDYRGSGVVLGSLGWNEKSTFQLDEDARGNLRVVTYNWNAADKKNKSNDPATRSPVVLTALAEQQGGAKKLLTLSRLPNRYYPQTLGKKGERLYGARLFDDYAYFVTFRQTDPLYVVDMRNPHSMKVAGKLVIPGFSDYLHPIDNGLLLGVGKEVEIRKDGRVGQTTGLKLSLFDIRNPSRPREISKVIIGDSSANTPVSNNHHALTTLKVGNSGITRVLLPANSYNADSEKQLNGLQRFEVDSLSKKINYLGEVASSDKRNWYWNYNDRSIMIGERVFYFHEGKFQESAWRAKVSKSPIKKLSKKTS
ncbi:MAG TPA: hypothetical protein EYH16_05160 [Leucothrix mucor]|nr:hypothetical protein [Leucothrix mucor]